MALDETTRLLCGSAILSAPFRQKFFTHYEDENRAVAPEVGVNVPLVAQVCQFAEDRQHKYTWGFFLILILALLFSLASPYLGLILLIFAGAALSLKKSTQERGYVRDYLQRTNFDPQKVAAKFPASVKPEIVSAFPDPGQNLLVYEGFTPFVGAGINLGGWSFIVDIEKGREDTVTDAEPADPIAFTAHDLYQTIDTEVQTLRLERMTIADYCFVHGAEIRNDQAILPDVHGRPVQRLCSESEEEFKKTSDARIRHYQWIRVQDWGGELVMSYFLRCAVRGSSLFVEINRFLLTPLFHPYRKADSVAKHSFGDYVNEFLKSIFLGPLKAIYSALVVLEYFNEWIASVFDTKARVRRKEIESNPLYNYGARASLRYTLGTDSFLHYFQKLDGEFYTKVLEHQILDAIVDFLDEHDIDTSEIRERRTTILNSGVIVQGGDLKAESLAVGAGATAIKSQAPSGGKRAAPKKAAA